MRKRSNFFAPRAACALILALLSALLPAAFCGCGRAEKKSAEELFSYPVEARVEFSGENGSCRLFLRMERAGKGSYRVEAPKELSGIEFLFEDGNCFVRKGEFTLPIGAESRPDGGYLFGAFSPPEGAELLRASARGEKASTTYALIGEDGNYRYVVGNGANVVLVEREGTGGFSARLAEEP